jgi:hypothetical protein
MKMNYPATKKAHRLPGISNDHHQNNIYQLLLSYQQSSLKQPAGQLLRNAGIGDCIYYEEQVRK